MQTVCYTKTCESVAEDHKFSIQPCSAHLAKHASVCLLCTHWLQQNGTVVCLSFLRDLINFICLFAGPHFESLNVFIHSTMHPVMAAYLIRSWFALRENKLSSPFLCRDVVITGEKKSRFFFSFSQMSELRHRQQQKQNWGVPKLWQFTRGGNIFQTRAVSFLVLPKTQ